MIATIDRHDRIKVPISHTPASMNSYEFLHTGIGCVSNVTLQLRATLAKSIASFTPSSRDSTI
jgi:hypothetical protein